MEKQMNYKAVKAFLIIVTAIWIGFMVQTILTF
jgi:hypothetical protein